MQFFHQKGNARTRRKLEHGFKGVGNHRLFYSKEHYGSLQDKPAHVTVNEQLYKMRVRQILRAEGLAASKHLFSHKGFWKRLVSHFQPSAEDGVDKLLSSVI